MAQQVLCKAALEVEQVQMLAEQNASLLRLHLRRLRCVFHRHVANSGCGVFVAVTDILSIVDPNSTRWQGCGYGWSCFGFLGF